MLLDDPLSAVDTTVSRHLFDKYAFGKCVGQVNVYCAGVYVEYWLTS